MNFNISKLVQKKHKVQFDVSMARFLLWNFFLLSALTQILPFAKGGMSFLQERGLKAELLPCQLYNMPHVISVPSSLF